MERKLRDRLGIVCVNIGEPLTKLESGVTICRRCTEALIVGMDGEVHFSTGLAGAGSAPVVDPVPVADPAGAE